MEKLTINAEQICVGDVFSDGDTVIDFEFFDYPTRKTVEVYVEDSKGDSYSKEFDRDARITIESDYVDREESADTEDWEDAIDNDIAEMNSQDSDMIVESVGDLLDY